jgi:hypothetical protein
MFTMTLETSTATYVLDHRIDVRGYDFLQLSFQPGTHGPSFAPSVLCCTLEREFVLNLHPQRVQTELEKITHD